MIKRYLLSAWTILIILPTILNGQKPEAVTSGEIYQKLKKLNVLASVLYVAAHPDDENTRLISYLANEKHAETTYLSLTRGDGGQNLIGKEIDELLGVLRTQELLQARAIDNGKQMFSRANDFGFSKNAEETISIWDTDKIKADVAWAIRSSKPDIIINRFDHRTSGKTHGHHTASAILALEIFDKSGDKTYHPEHLQFVDAWQAKRIFFNTSWWFYGSQEKFDKADKSLLMGFDVGVYYPLLGKSNNEISAESRSQHKCQGFGSTGSRGSQMEYLELLKGEMPADKQNIFEGINTTWSRVKGGEEIGKLVEKTIQSFDFTKPEASVPALLEIYNLIQKTEDLFWKTQKSKECIDIIEACSGLYVEAKSNKKDAIPGENIKIDIEITKRLPVEVTLHKIQSEFFGIDSVHQTTIEDNQMVFHQLSVRIPQNAEYTTPYWLRTEGSLGMYQVDKTEWIGKPETPHPAQITYTLDFKGTKLPITKHVVHKFNSPENGEEYRSFSILPRISVNFTNKVNIFANSEKQPVTINIINFADSTSGILALPMPKGWRISPRTIPFTITGKGQSQEFTFEVTPPDKSSEVSATPKVLINDEVYMDALEEIKYDHIVPQWVQQKASADFVRLDINIVPMNIAYVDGAGDVIPDYLVKMGYKVDKLSDADLRTEILQKYPCVIFGVRSYNTIDALKFKQKDILKYVENGGKVVVQYNTSNGLVIPQIGPYPFKISRERVTVEDAEMKILQPEHLYLQFPNKIGEKDFVGWVQERGLYFASEWDSKYQTIFSCNDPGETPNEGSLIFAGYGKGEFVYTGLSFFRQFPAGVAGAYRLFANIITPQKASNHDGKP
ncbi:MAG: PIG-L family deacetylase [Saprospiraceae bacterium]|nr:PIG-L family deacetylase [Saprospiraceae bacterium]